MDLRLTDAVALIVGGSSGIGADVAVVLAEEGCDVALTYASSVEGAEDTAHRVHALGRRAWTHRLDLTATDLVGAEIAGFITEIGGIDIAVLCAGRNVITPFPRVTAREWQEIVAVNLTGPFLVLQQVARSIRPGGSIVTVASVAAHTGAPHHAHYAAAKAGLVNLTRTLARELAPDVRVNCVAPGITLTPMGRDTIATLDEDYAQRKLLLQKYATSRGVAELIVFVASPVNAFMTGATIDVNSGRDLR